MARALVPILGSFFVAAIAVGFVQGKPTLSRSRLKPQWKKVNPSAGLKRVFGTQGLVDFAKILAKCVSVLVTSILVLRAHAAPLD